MEAIFGLLKNRFGVEFESFFGDFFLAIGGQAVKDEVLWVSVGEEGLVDLVVGKEGFFLGLVFLSHREPDIGVDNASAGGGFVWIGGESYIWGVEVFEKFGGGEAGCRSGDGEGKAEVLGGPHP